MVSVGDHYNNADVALKNKIEVLFNLDIVRSEKIKAKTNYNSIRAMVAKELDKSLASKAALKILTDGDSRVTKALEVWDLLKEREKGLEEQKSYLDDNYTLEKKRMAILAEELARLGG